jgi:hypothetical protein
VTSIEQNAFCNCNNLTSVQIPCSVTHIKNRAFYCCGAIKRVHYNGSKKEWYNIEIGDDNLDLLKVQRTYGR